jgi:glycolate oxidase FAD binding subunit
VDLMVVTTVDGVDDLREAIATADAVVAVGGRTQWEVGNPPRPDAVAVQAPEGVVAYDPADLTVTVAAGTHVADLAARLADAGQECALDARSGDATVGGVLAAGLSGHRRLRYGPLRDRVLEVRFVAGDGRVIKAGGPTVKNVSGFDLPRLLVGSLGTVGVIVQVTLRCQPIAAVAEWCETGVDPFELRRHLYRPSCLAWNGTTTHVLLEGEAVDVAAERAAIGGEVTTGAGPAWPSGPHRGRISVRPSALRALATALDAIRVRWIAEVGVGTVHVAAEREGDLARARRAAEDQGGWLLREAGALGLDGFGRELPNHKLTERVRAAFDPAGKLGPGRLPRPQPLVHGEG